MALSLGFSTMLPSTSAFFSPTSLATCICTAAKATMFINILSVSPNSVALGVSSIVGTIALGFLTDSTMAQTNSDSAFYNGDSPISLRRPTTSTRITNSTPPLLTPDCQGVRSKQILAAFATICASLVGSAYVMYLASQNSFSSSSEHPRDHQRPLQRDRGRDPAPWPVPPPSRRPSRSEPPNRRPDFSTGGRPCKVDTHHNRPLKRPFREDPPPPPPPSLAGFIEDFPKPKNFQELIIMNIMLGALFGWILKKLIGYFPGRRVSQRTQHVSSSLPKRTATSSSIPRKTRDCSRSIPSRSRLPLLPEQRQTPRPLNLKQKGLPVSALLTFTLAGSGTLVLFRLKARCRATNARHSPNQPIIPHAVFRPLARDRDSTFAYPVARELGPPAGTFDRSPRSKPTSSPYRRQSSTTCRSPSAVRLSKTEQVRYFYKDDIIGFENGPRSSRRSACAP